MQCEVCGHKVDVSKLEKSILIRVIEKGWYCEGCMQIHEMHSTNSVYIKECDEPVGSALFESVDFGEK